VLDYHLHLWPHDERETPLRLEQLAEYCEKAQAAGVEELAVTEHLFRFRQAEACSGASGTTTASRRPAESMAEYWEFHATADLDAYVECAQEAKEAGLPVVIGLEVDYYQGRMDEVADPAGRLPLRRPARLGALGGRLALRRHRRPVQMAEWSVRQVDACWEAYTGRWRSWRRRAPATCWPTPT
jgi:histidinol-phosphatase (PHP family)